MKVKKWWLLILVASVFMITSTLTCAYAVEPADWANKWLKGNFVYKPTCQAETGVEKANSEKISGYLFLGELVGNNFSAVGYLEVDGMWIQQPMDFVQIVLGDGDGNIIEGQLTLSDCTVVNFIAQGKAKEKNGELKQIQLKSIGGYLLDLVTDLCGASFKFTLKSVDADDVPQEVIEAPYPGPCPL